MDTAKIERTLREVVALLVEKNYGALEALSNGVRLTASEIEMGVAAYGRILVAPPNEAFEQADIVAVAGTARPTYLVRFRLYTLEEGRSDLELQATLIDCEAPETMIVEVDNILVA